VAVSNKVTCVLLKTNIMNCYGLTNRAKATVADIENNTGTGNLIEEIYLSDNGVHGALCTVYSNSDV